MTDAGYALEPGAAAVMFPPLSTRARGRATHQSKIGPVCRRGQPVAYHFIWWREIRLSTKTVSVRCGADATPCYEIQVR
jgi:hypothetical protein